MSPFINSLEDKILFVITQKESNEEGHTVTMQRKEKKNKKKQTRGKKILRSWYRKLMPLSLGCFSL